MERNAGCKGKGNMRKRKLLKPKTTESEYKVRALLRDRKIPFEYGRKLYYTLTRYYTPDLIVGGNLVLEIDGKIHDETWKITPDRIRQRALEMMGYTVMRIRNEEIDKNPQRTAELITERFYTVTGVDKEMKIIRLNPPKVKGRQMTDKEEKHVENVLPTLDNLLDLDMERLAVEIESMIKGGSNEPDIVVSILLKAFGLTLLSAEDGGSLNYDAASKNFQKCIIIVEKMFGESRRADLKNSFLITAPGFIKNLVFKGGPWMNTGIVNIGDADKLKKNVAEFNQFFEPLGMIVEMENVITECCFEVNKSEPSQKRQWIRALCPDGS